MRHAVREGIWRPLIDLPFETGGRGPTSYDCVGVMERVLREHLGIDSASLAPGDSISSEDLEHWDEVDAREAIRRAGVVTVTTDADGALHVFTCLGDGRSITASEGRGVFVLPTRAVTRGAVSSRHYQLRVGARGA